MKLRRIGERADGVRLRDLDAMHVFMPHLMPNRADCEAFVQEQIDMAPVQAYIDRRNAENPEYKYTIFHVVAAALAKTVTLRPKMNRFIAGRRAYQRKSLSLAFVAKKVFSDNGGEALLFFDVGEDITIDTLHEKIWKRVSSVRKGGSDNNTDILEKLKNLPRWALRLFMGALKALDYFGMVPNFLIKEDPDFASIYISNLGSIKLNANYHHLNNWGTNSLFVVIGEKHSEIALDENGAVVSRELLPVSITLDERIADGYYYAKTIKLFKYLMRNPELLERPAREEVAYE